MTKTNYTKVEEALNEGLRKIEVNRLLEIADEVSDKHKKTTEIALSHEQKQLLASIVHDLKSVQKIDKDPFAKLGIAKKELKKYLKKPSSLGPKEWELLKAFKEKIRTFKAELEKSAPKATDADVINQQRRKQTTKRFNVNDKWIPLR